MKNNNLTNESLEVAGEVASRKEIYVTAILGGVLTGISEKSFAAGVKYAIFGVGAQIIWNTTMGMAFDRIL